MNPGHFKPNPPWTPQETAVVRAMYPAGTLMQDIIDLVDAYGVRKATPNAVMRQAKLLGVSRPRGNTVWAAEHEAKLTELHALGWSMQLIANAINRKFGTTYERGSVIGKANRLGLSQPMRSSVARAAKKRLEEPEEPEPPEGGVPAPAPRTQCQYPLWPDQGYTPPAERRYCGAPTKRIGEDKRSSYCERHHKACHSTALQRRADREEWQEQNPRGTARRGKYSDSMLSGPQEAA